MAKVHVNFEFDSVEEATRFFGEHSPRVIGSSPALSAPYGQQSAASAPAAAPTPTPTQAPPPNPVATSSVGTALPGSAAPAATPPAPATSGTEDYGLAVRTAMNAAVARVDAKGTPGAGALKAKEILTAHGLTRSRDVTPEQAPALIAALNAVA